MRGVKLASAAVAVVVVALAGSAAGNAEPASASAGGESVAGLGQPAAALAEASVKAQAQDSAKTGGDKARLDALKEGTNLREMARRQAQERAKRQKEGKPPLPDAPPTKAEAGAEKAKAESKGPRPFRPPPGVSAKERRRLEQEHKHRERVRILREIKEEELQALARGDPHGRRLQQTPPKPPSCSDSEKNGQETDVDCGGGDCRDKWYHDNGVQFPHTCSFAQQCHVNRDCTSKTCTAGTCAARAPFGTTTDAQLTRSMHTAFYRLTEGQADRTLAADKAKTFFLDVVNPDAQEIPPALQDMFEREFAAFSDSQGLKSAGALRYGFLTRGRCFDFAKRLIDKARTLAIRSEL